MTCSLRAVGSYALILATAVALCCVWARQHRDQLEANAVFVQDREIEETRILLRKRIEVKERLVDEIIDGRLTLPEVTEQFMQLNQTYPEIVTHTRERYPGATDREKTARQVLCYIHSQFRMRPELTAEQRDRVLQRVEAQLQEMCK